MSMSITLRSKYSLEKLFLFLGRGLDVRMIWVNTRLRASDDILHPIIPIVFQLDHLASIVL